MAKNNVIDMDIGAVSRELITFARALKEHGLLATVQEISITHQVNNLYETVTLTFKHENEYATMSHDEGRVDEKKRQ